MNQIKRARIIAGNWKMNKTNAQALDFVKNLIPLLPTEDTKVFLAVPFTAIHVSAEAAKNTPLIIGAQNMNDASEGAFTGEIAAVMLKEAGAQFVILGHSERRRFFHENNAFINKKVKRALIEGLRPILCIGETKEERDAGHTQEVLQKQLSECLENISANQLKGLIIAYEPIWAIGAFEGASPEQAQETHKACRAFLSQILGSEFSEQTVIQYGGTVTSENAAHFLEQPDIDGLLVGRASLSLESFVEIINTQSDTIKHLNNIEHNEPLENNEDET